MHLIFNALSGITVCPFVPFYMFELMRGWYRIWANGRKLILCQKKKKKKKKQKKKNNNNKKKKNKKKKKKKKQTQFYY